MIVSAYDDKMDSNNKQTTLLKCYLNIYEHQLLETLYILYIKPKMQLYALSFV